MTPDHVWCIGDNVVEVWESTTTVRTRLPCGLTILAAPERTPEYLERALSLGYGWHSDPAWAMCREHDAVHLLLGDAMGLPTSRTLEDVAHGLSLEAVGASAVPEHQWLEEGRVMDLQLYLNTGDASRSYGGGAIYELSSEIDLPSFRRRALTLLRE